MPTPPVPAPADPNLPMRGPLTTSFMLHCGVFLAINALAWANVRSVQRQSDAFIEHIAKKERRDAEQARKEQADAAKDAAKSQLAMEMADIIAADVRSPDLDRIMAMTTDGISDLFQDQDGGAADYDQDRLAALDRVQANADQLLREALVAQVRQYIRDQVAPEIKERIAHELKNQTGGELEKTFAGKLREDKAKRLHEDAGALRKQAEELGQERRELEQARGEAERGEAKPAGERAGKARDALGKTEQAVAASAAAAAHDDPSLAKDAEAAKDSTAERAAVDQASASAPGEKTTAVADLAAAGQAIEQRAQALGKLAQQLDEHANNQPGFDGLERRIAAAAKDQVDTALRDQVAREVTDKAIPEATDKIMQAVGKDLGQLGIKQEEFAGLLKQDIAKALSEGLGAPDASAAWLRTEQAVGLDASRGIDAARDAVSTAAEKLAALAQRQDAIKAVADHPINAQAPQESALADDIATAERSAKDALTTTREDSLASEAEVDRGLEQLRHHSSSDLAAHAAAASRNGNVSDAARFMDDTARTLRESAAKLTEVAGALDREIAARDAAAKDLAAKMGPLAAKSMTGSLDTGATQSADALAAAGKQVVSASANRSVDTAVGQFQAGNVLGNAGRLAQLKQLMESVAQAKKNAAEGRTGGSPTLFGAPAGGMRGKGVAKAALVRFNRDAYEAFVKDLRSRTNPGNAYAPVAEVTGIDSVAEPESGPFPAVVYAPAKDQAKGQATDAANSQKSPTSPKPPERKVEEPTYKHVAFGCAAMVEHPIVIDGDLGDWGELTHPMAMQYGVQDANARIENGTKVYMRWSNDGLYLGYVVHDDGGVQQPSAKTPYMGDCLEFFIDMENGRRGAMAQSQFSHQFIFTPFGCAEEARVTFSEIGRSFRGLSQFQPYPDTERKRGWSAAKQIAGGYSVECFVKRQALSKPVLVPGAYLAINFSVNIDAQEAHQTQWSASKAINSWDKPDTWGDVLLLGADASVRALTLDAKPLERVIPGQAVMVEITDPDMDLDPAHEDRVMATVGVKDAVDQVMMVLKETGPDTGVFRGSLNTQLYLDEARKNTVSIRPGDVLEIGYDDPRAAYGEQHRRVAADLPVAHPVITLSLRQTPAPSPQ